MTRLADMVATLPKEAPPKRPAKAPQRPAIVETPAIDSSEYGGMQAPAPAAPAPKPQADPAAIGGPPGRVQSSGREVTRSRAQLQAERRQAFEDLWYQLGAVQPDPTRAGLAKCLRELAKSPVAIMERDALVRLAAWAIGAAVSVGYEMPASPRPVADLFATTQES